MLPPPGYSINDLITVATWVKNVYDSFFHEFKNADSQLGDLARDVDAFQEKLQQYQQNLAHAGLEDPGKESVRKTLIQCATFLDEYKSARKNKDGRRRSFIGTVKTGLFAGEEAELRRLKDKLNEHKLDMVLDSVNIMSKGRRSRQMLSATMPIPIPGRASTSISPTIPEDTTPPISPPVTPSMILGSPLLGSGSFDPLPPRPAQRRSRNTSFDSIVEAATPALIAPVQAQLNVEMQSNTALGFDPLPPRLAQRRSRNTSFDSIVVAATPSQIIPTPAPIALVQAQLNVDMQSTTALGFSLPGPVRLYGIGEVKYGPGKRDCMEFCRKPIGSDYERGRQIEIRDEGGKQCFRHRIRISVNDSLYPFTCQKSNQATPGYFIVKLKEAPPPNHKISRDGGEQVRPPSIPTYIFTDERDYEDFQGEVRGKLLEGSFEIDFINSAASTNRKHEASDQHLKIWRDRFSKECSLSYYASLAEKPRHVEYPISMFHSDIGGDDWKARLDFIAASSTPKKTRTFSVAFSKGPSESSSSTTTKSPRIFDRTNSGMFSAGSSMTSAPPSRRSVTSSNISGSAQTLKSDNESALESQAKKLKFLEFEFSDETGKETTRFKNLFKTLREEPISTGLDRVINWQVSTRPGRPESVMSTSPRGTPFTQSPEMRATTHYLDQR